MQSLWSDGEAAGFRGDLAQRVYTSRLLGRDKSLVLHGGGNTSVKIREKNLFGEEQDLLYVKGSGWDLETIEPAGFTPVALDYVKRLATLPSLDALRGKIIGLLQAPATKIAGVLAAPAGQVARVIGAYGAKGDGAKAA